DGKGPKIVSFYAKKARGAMARFVVQNRLTDAEAIKDFDIGGYAWQKELSTPEKPVFVRPYPTS
ncbi:MAG TPA: peroxide stress protein YaaA, partial [Sulfitobacter sp.]|nr:peroxide stress protein YaaA [Sulfitobacter sp.]